VANDFLVFDSLRYSGDCRALGQAYGQLPKALAKKHIKAAVNRAIRPFVPALKAATPKSSGRRVSRAAVKRDGGGRFQAGSGKKSIIKPGRLRRSIITITKFSNKVNHGSFTARVTFSRGAGKGNHALWVEEGTAARANGKGAGRGRVSPRWFLRSLFQSMAPGIANSMDLHLAAGLEAAGRELQKYLDKRKRG
jgi:hypothetical protein